MIFTNPLRGTLHPTTWKRPTGNLDFRLVQDFGPTSVTAEPSLSWPGGEAIAPAFYAHFHRGNDFGNAHCGADVLAAAKGKVVLSTVLSDGANVIVIDHGYGWLTGYFHLATRAVVRGVAVTAAQKIGTVGSTGNSSACHLHFGVKSNADPAISFFSNTNGKWRDPWPRLAQNVTVSLRAAGINIRQDAKLGPIFATSKEDGLIHRVDGTVLGPLGQQHNWGGTVAGASYTLGGVVGNKWEKIYLDGAYRYVASPLAALSAT